MINTLENLLDIETLIIAETCVPSSLEYYGFCNGIFSAWYPTTFSEGGITYYSAIQYYNAKKALHFGDHKIYEKIIHTRDPSKAAYLGRKVSPFDDNEWGKVCTSIMYQANKLKFDANPEFKNTLINTDNQILVACLVSDDYWGAGIDIMSHIDTPKEWPGKNIQGFLLMKLRLAYTKE